MPPHATATHPPTEAPYRACSRRRGRPCPPLRRRNPRMTEQTLVEQALHLPRREARRWRHTPLEQEDLVADGNLALAKAARRYDPSYGVPFPAFATPYVRGAIADTVRTRARRNNLGDGVFADVVGFPDLARSAQTAEREYEPADPGPTPHDTVESLDR